MPGWKQISTNLRVDFIAAILWIMLGGVVVFNTWSLPYISRLGPGPGFFPFWIGVGLILLGALLLAGSFSQTEEAAHSWPNRRAALDMSLLIAILAGFALLAERIGFTVGVGLTFFFHILLIERGPWLKAAAIAVVSSALFWVAFVWFLGMQLPTGFFNI